MSSDKASNVANASGGSGLGCLGLIVTIWVLFHLAEVGDALGRIVNQAAR